MKLLVLVGEAAKHRKSLKLITVPECPSTHFSKVERAKMKSTREVPLTISGYTILPIFLPSLPSLPVAATHFLYLRPHEPKIPNSSSPRSLFLVNIPFDTTEAHLRVLFSTQIGLPSGRLEEVLLDSAERRSTSITEVDAEPRPLGQHPSQSQPANARKGKKRKRDQESSSYPELNDAQFPSTWDRTLFRSGSTAIVVFVDRASLDAVLRAVKRTRKSQTRISWGGDGIATPIPPLGSQRPSSHSLRTPFQPD